MAIVYLINTLIILFGSKRCSAGTDATGRKAEPV